LSKIQEITEATAVPIGLMIVIIGAVLTIGSMRDKVEAHETRIQRVEDTETRFTQEVIDRLARIETKINGIKRSHKQGE